MNKPDDRTEDCYIGGRGGYKNLPSSGQCKVTLIIFEEN